MPLLIERIKISEQIGPTAITLEKGQKIYDCVYDKLKDRKLVELDFTGVKVVTTLFINTAIGQLLKNFELEDVKRLLVENIIGLDKQWLTDIDFIVTRSEKYYKNQEFRQAVDRVLQERSENPEAW